MQSVYIETTIPSYLTAWPARNLIAAAHQAIMREWWALRRDSFRLFVSQLVITEASAGDPAAAQLRLAALEGIPLPPSTESVEWIASEFERLGLVCTPEELMGDVDPTNA